ncbi:site-specific integrase [Paenibacillus polymyxa]|uniref:Site-specific integrase n=1 Tax=Paenibacillus polymyxa TaxID=1406 RepID=A0A8I1LQ21_PAEPO|nr:site-specific integrase [Paenibacillus sp. EKM206P]KAF6590564.1 site-specific integrase [Paenibacillus sp. EKM205P]MBM0632650.1 site-specific integrase [Paenibacillus polymyxa]
MLLELHHKIEELEYENFSFGVDVAFAEYWIKKERATRKHAVIVLKNKLDGKMIVHPLTAFIQWRWKYKEYNTQRLHGVHLSQFLNYVLIKKKRKYELKSLSELTNNHGTDFLNYLLSKGNANVSVKNVERTLRCFYNFLAEKDCLIHDIVLHPFNPMYSKEFAYDMERGKLAIEHTLPNKYIFVFLRTALSISPSIAFAIYLSIFGGLRAGEIVNIRVNDLRPYGDEYGKGGLLILLKTQNLRTDIKDTSGSSRVKRDRKQFVYSVKNMLSVLYKLHLNNLQRKLGSEFSGSSPLFVNANGKALTGKSLRDRFGKVKEAFLKNLTSSENPNDMITAINLQSTKWSFHIGRGTFTNLLARAAVNPYDIALPRGDKNIPSSLTYMSNSEEMKLILEDLIDSIYKE